jgi:hypothetical protein
MKVFVEARGHNEEKKSYTPISTDMRGMAEQFPIGCDGDNRVLNGSVHMFGELGVQNRFTKSESYGANPLIFSIFYYRSSPSNLIIEINKS